jgi:hypothetical protein
LGRPRNAGPSTAFGANAPNFAQDDGSYAQVTAVIELRTSDSGHFVDDGSYAHDDGSYAQVTAVMLTMTAVMLTMTSAIQLRASDSGR